MDSEDNSAPPEANYRPGQVLTQASFAPDIASLLSAIGWKDEAAAQHIGVHRNMITRWRSKGAPIDVIVYLQNVLISVQAVASPERYRR